MELRLLFCVSLTFERRKDVDRGGPTEGIGTLHQH